MPYFNWILRKLGRYRWNSDLDQKKVVGDAKTILDVGANIGQTSITYRRLFPNAKIWAFEPVPETFAVLASKFKGDSHVSPVMLALSDSQGTATMYKGPASITNSMMKRWDRRSETFQIQTDTADNFCATHGITFIDLLKMDVGGVEAKVLRGAAEMFRRSAIKFVFTEVLLSPAHEDPVLFWELHEILSTLGFRLYGLYSLSPEPSGRLHFANALYDKMS